MLRVWRELIVAVLSDSDLFGVLNVCCEFGGS